MQSSTSITYVAPRRHVNTFACGFKLGATIIQGQLGKRRKELGTLWAVGKKLRLDLAAVLQLYEATYRGEAGCEMTSKAPLQVLQGISAGVEKVVYCFAFELL